MIQRFAVENSYFRPSNNTVKWKAFEPKDGATSVFCLDHMNHVAKCAHGQQYVGDEREPKKAVLGYAEVAESEIARVELNVVPDEPPPHHLNLVDWPADPDKAKLIALELAEAARFVRV